jgi:TolA-binding protein
MKAMAVSAGLILWAGAIFAAGLLPEQMLAEAGNLLEKRQTARAVARYDELLARYGQHPVALEAMFRKGIALRELKRYPEAVACWENVLGRMGANEWKDDCLLEMARTQAFSLKDYTAAENSYARLLREYPKSDRRLEAEYQLAGITFLKADYPTAKSRLEKFLKDYPNNPVATEAKECLARCEAALNPVAKRVETPPSKKPATEGEKLLAEADALFAKKDYKEAQARYERLVTGFKAAPEYDRAALRNGQCWKELDEPQRALRTWQELVRWKPQSAVAAEAMLEMGSLHLEDLNDPVAAQAAFEKLLAEYPQSLLAPQAWHRLGLALFRQGQWDRAKSVFVAEQTAQGGPNTNAPPTELDRLIAACDAKKPLTPDRPRGRDKLESQIATADLLFTAKEYAKAARVYEKVVRAQPGSEPAAYCLMQAGRCYVQLFKPQQAIQCYRPFLKEYANSPWADDALVRAAVIYVGQLRDTKTGGELLQAIVTRYPDGDQADRALVHLAALATWAKNWTNAEMFYNKLLRRYPKSDYARYVKTVALPALEKHKQPAIPATNRT